MNQSNRLLAKKCLSKGGITQTVVDVRLAIKNALEIGATGMILAHNHPSGVAEPSQADIAITTRLTSALNTIDVRVLDHVVVGRNEAVSFAERGLL